MPLPLFLCPKRDVTLRKTCTKTVFDVTEQQADRFILNMRHGSQCFELLSGMLG